MTTNPSSFGTASLIAGIGGAITSAVGGYFGAATQKINLQAQAHIAEANARLAEISAQSALIQGHQQVAALTLQAGQLKSRQRAAMAANGIDLGVGNAAEVQASTEIMKEIDANTTISNSVKNAWRIRAQAMNYQNEALVKHASASAISPGMNLATSLISGVGKVAAACYDLNPPGAAKSDSAGGSGGLGDGLDLGKSGNGLKVPGAGVGINVPYYRW